MEVNQIFQGGLLLAAVTYLGYALKGVPGWIWDRIERRVIYKVNIDELDELYYYFEKWLIVNHAEKYRNVEASLNFVKGDGTFEMVPKTENADSNKIVKNVNYKQYEDFFTIHYLGKRLYIFKGREKFENASNIRNAFFNRYKITGFRARTQIEALLKEVLEYNLKLEAESRKINIYTNNNWGEWALVQDLKTKDINSIIIKASDKNNLLKDVLEFEASEKWYTDRCITYKRGYLFDGPPGNGKTSLCLSLARKLKRDIYFLTGDVEDNISLNKAMQNLKPNAILAMEDVDCLFDKREIKKENKEVGAFNFSTLLNCLDGAFSKGNIITIMTTNHIEKIDPALIRAGRIDMKLHIGNPERRQIEQYLEIFYGSPVQLNFELQSNQHLSMSAVQDICIMNKNDSKKAVKELERKYYGLNFISYEKEHI